MVSLQTDGQKDGQTDTGNTIRPDLSMRGHKKTIYTLRTVCPLKFLTGSFCILFGKVGGGGGTKNETGIQEF